MPRCWVHGLAGPITLVTMSGGQVSNSAVPRVRASASLPRAINSSIIIVRTLVFYIFDFPEFIVIKNPSLLSRINHHNKRLFYFLIF